jgi:biotin carboxyl carrier protein
VPPKAGARSADAALVMVGCDHAQLAKGAPVADEVRAEMVANVWKIVVTEGQQVDDGDTLVILESMKMEIPVIAESAGTVSIKIAEGDVVQEGDLIAVIE